MSYVEYSPPASLAGIVECFWTGEESASELHRVVPDGCIDIICSGTVFVVGAMTAHQMAKGGSFAAVRLRPGAGGLVLGHPAHLFTDSMPPLAEVWGACGARLERRLASAGCVRERASLLATELEQRFGGTVREPVFDWLDACGGCVIVDDLARQAGWSVRHLRRVLPPLTGLGPKQLCRILRFRRAWKAVRGGRGLARIAAEAGFNDQPHMTHEFRTFAGCTPGEVMSVFSRTRAAAHG
jgi:AraC-like DNA-binding protein